VISAKESLHAPYFAPFVCVPAGFIVHDIVSQEGRTTVVVRHGSGGGVCPSCAAPSRSVKLLTCAERIQYDGYLQREETNAAILALSKKGLADVSPVKQATHAKRSVASSEASAPMYSECGKVR
jgi:hypothetical protein